ncbi:hypothetical protein MMO39_13125 [Acinetobacter modestus]|uniref:hypothetical protein n=1 Tax=Acinetobacter modestus TaxID=1776740 RepID=UPI001F4A67A9|nr:hypothetical protein [Acinetobacter modestus]MCH7334609.1 hypothetical protein [Acinetobacter modestus]MCH7388231.1 hypothetical protein [Acinetobacter modestus]
MKRLFVLAPCLMGLWTESVLAQDCISLREMQETRIANIKNEYDPNNRPWVKEYIWDKLKFSGVYSYGSERSFEDEQGKTWKDNSKHKSEVKVSYEVPLNILYQKKKEVLNNEKLKNNALEKTQFDSDNAILDWRIANNLLQRKQLELEGGVDNLSPTKKKIAELEIEEMQYKVDKLANQIKNLNGITSASNICI